MKRPLNQSSLAVLCIIAGVLPSFAEDPFEGQAVPSDPQPAKIMVEGDTLFFDGETSEESWAALLDLSEDGATQNVSRMVITSPGGDTVAGRAIASWVHDNIEVLEVDGICFSSCANYIFAAAPRKIIREDAIVGWHGSERTSEIVSLNYPGVSARNFERAELREAILNDQPDLHGTNELTRVLDREYAWFEHSRADEARFFQTIGVDDKITYFGLLPGQYRAYLDSGLDGWTFSLADMERFGIGNVSYAGKGSYIHSSKLRKQVYILTLSDEILPPVR